MTTPTAVGAQGTFYKFKAVHGSLAPNRKVVENCWINSSSPSNFVRCKAYTTQTMAMDEEDWPVGATQCNLHINLDCRYCTKHLYDIEKLSIDVSDHLYDKGIYGLGLYYGKRIISDRAGEKPLDFKNKPKLKLKRRTYGPEHTITKYIGKTSDAKAQATKWDFDDADGVTVDVTNPYAVAANTGGQKKTDGVAKKCIVFDSSCRRSAGVYANTSHVMSEINAKLVPTLKNPRLVAIEKLVYGDEILVRYDKKRVGVKKKGKDTALKKEQRRAQRLEDNNQYWGGVGPTHILFATIMFKDGRTDAHIENVFQGKFEDIAANIPPTPPAVKRGKRDKTAKKKRKANQPSDRPKSKRPR
jgi:hypothetical protein